MPQKEVLLMRHAKSSWKDPSLNDHDRPLNGRGRRASDFMGQFLLERDLRPDIVVCSSTERARATCERMLKQWNQEIPRRIEPQLYLADSKVYKTTICKFSDKYHRVMIIGHHTGLEVLVNELLGAKIHFPTAAVAWVQYKPSSWVDIQVEKPENIVIWKPRELQARSA